MTKAFFVPAVALATRTLIMLVWMLVVTEKGASQG